MNLEDIAREAAQEFIPAADVTGQAAAQPGASPPPAPDADEQEAKEWSQAPAVFGMILSRALPELKATYTHENNLAWGRAMVPVAHHYGWTAAAFFAWLGPWVGLAIATETLAGPTYDAIRNEITRRKKAKAEAPAADTTAGEGKPAV
jgi:hypothetical protein